MTALVLNVAVHASLLTKDDSVFFFFFNLSNFGTNTCSFASFKYAFTRISNINFYTEAPVYLHYLKLGFL